MSARIRVYRDSKKWKLGIQIGDGVEKSGVIQLNPDKTLKEPERLYTAINTAIVKGIAKPKAKKAPLAPAQAKRVTAVWPGEIEEGNRDWISLVVSKDETGSVVCTIRDEFDGQTQELPLEADAAQKMVEMVQSLIKRPIKDPRQVEMFEPPSTARDYRSEIRQAARKKP
jgi:hypothetical protein